MNHLKIPGMRYSQLTNYKRNLFAVQSQENLHKKLTKQDMTDLQFSQTQKKNIQKSTDKELNRKFSPNSKLQLPEKYLSKKLPSKQKSKQKYIDMQTNQKNKLRSTFSVNYYIPKAQININQSNDKNGNLCLPGYSMRKSFNPSERFFKQRLEKNIEYSNLQSSLNILQSKILNAKKQLQKKKEKRMKIQQQKCISQKEEMQLQKKTFKSQQSQISNPQSTNTVKITKQLRISSLVTSVPKPRQAKPFQFNPYSPRKHNCYYVSQIIRAIHEKNSIARQHINSSIKILRILQNQQIPSYSEIEQKKLNLKKSQYYKDKKTLVFDLDQTLIHCIQNNQNDCDVRLPITFTTGQQITAGINIRPHCLILLNQLVKNFELIIFTASHSCYANAVLDYLDPQKKLFQHRLYRQHCYYTQSGMYIKDLRIINRNLSQMVLIDNAAYSYAFQLQNGIPILPYYQGTNDYELKQLKSYLQKVMTSKDVRELNKKTFKLHEYLKYKNSQQLIEELYIKNS